jgi:hemerythrin
MNFDYQKLEEQLNIACTTVHNDFIKKFESNIYISAGGAKLEVFIDDMQKEFKNVAVRFLKDHELEKDAEAKKRVFSIIKLYAKRCIDDFSKV